MRSDRSRESPTPASPPVSGLVALLCSIAGAVTLAFLIPLGTLASCSSSRIALFLVLLVISAVLMLAGVVIGGVSYRRNRDRLAPVSLLFAVVYAGLLVYLLGLVS